MSCGSGGGKWPTGYILMPNFLTLIEPLHKYDVGSKEEGRMEVEIYIQSFMISRNISGLTCNFLRRDFQRGRITRVDILAGSFLDEKGSSGEFSI